MCTMEYGCRAASAPVIAVSIYFRPVHYEAIDRDHNGMPFWDADKKRLCHESDLLPDILHLKVGVRVIVWCNINIEHVWVNGTIAQVVSLAQNCIVLCQVDKSKVCLSVSLVSAPVGRRKNTTSASCYRWKHHGCKWNLCQWLREKHHHRKLLPVTTTASTRCNVI